jgi:hypothetical protein
MFGWGYSGRAWVFGDTAVILSASIAAPAEKLVALIFILGVRWIERYGGEG